MLFRDGTPDPPGTASVTPPSSADADDTIDEQIRDAIAIANIPTLLLVLVHMTGDRRWLVDPYRPSRSKGLDDNDSGGLTPEAQEAVRSAALDAITAWRRGQPLALASPEPEVLLEMLTAAMGEPIPAAYGPMIASDMAAVTHSKTGPQPRSPGPVDRCAIIIGAGFSGLCAAVRLGQAGVAYTILERHDAVGGVWAENRYPGAGVDTPSHLYEYSFAPHDWPDYFSTQSAVNRYLNEVADAFDVRPHIRFGVKVECARYDEDTQSWAVAIARVDGSRETLRGDYLISAVGAFNQPKVPGIKGIDAFAGPLFHTARWPDVNLAGMRVAVIGNGASAMQVVPAIADEVASLTIFQRSPHWIAPFDKLHQPVPAGVRTLFREVPLAHAWYRQRLAWTFNDRLHPSLQRDPTWPHPDRSVNAINDRHREYFTAYIRQELGGRPELIDAVLPTYPPYGKRILMDNGWYRSLLLDNVELVTSPVAELTEHAVVSADGREVDVDIVVFATGFEVGAFLGTFDVVGRDGQTLRDAWDADNPRAYLGLAVPGFPNLFILYGPNTQPGHGGSLIPAVEAQVHYVIGAIEDSVAAGLPCVEIRRDVFDAYNQQVDQAHAGMVWTHPGMDTYYRNARGRVVVSSPFRVVDFWAMSRADRRDHFVEMAAL